jgi:hypothetical protein
LIFPLIEVETVAHEANVGMSGAEATATDPVIMFLMTERLLDEFFI